MFFSHVLTRTIRQQQDDGDDAHQEYDAQIEPKGLDMPAAQDLFTTIKRRAAQFVVWREINDTVAGYEIVIDDINHPSLVGTCHKLLQLDVEVVLLQFQKGFFALLFDNLGYHIILLEGIIVATFGQNLLGLLHIVIQGVIGSVASVGLHSTELGEHGQVGIDDTEMSRIHVLTMFLLVVHCLQLRLQLVKVSEIIELVLLSGLIEFEEGLLIFIIRE